MIFLTKDQHLAIHNALKKCVSIVAGPKFKPLSQTKGKQIMATRTTDTKIIEETTKVLLPKKGITKDKDGENVWGYLPYSFKFKTKDEYLAWKRLWKETYAALSLEIRNLKNERSNCYKTGFYLTGTRDIEKDKIYSRGGYCDASCRDMAKEATAYLDILREAKLLAGVQSKRDKITSDVSNQ